MITAKVVLQTKTSSFINDTLTFVPDYADGRNKDWADATPALNFSVTVKKHIGDMFAPGKAYTLQIVEEVN